MKPDLELAAGATEPLLMDAHGRLLATCPKCNAQWAGAFTMASTAVPTLFDFGTALRLLKAGKRVRRRSWEKSTFLFLDRNVFWFGSLNDSVVRLQAHTLTSNGDALAEDWELVP